nr:hypothetical protein [Escherichia coli]
MELHDKVIGHYLKHKTLSISWSHYLVFDASHNVFDYKVLRKNFNEPLE